MHTKSFLPPEANIILTKSTTCTGKKDVPKIANLELADRLRPRLEAEATAASAANSFFSSNSFSVTSLNQDNAPSKVSGLARSNTMATPWAYCKYHDHNDGNEYFNQ